MKKRVLGIDLGIGSVGWALLDFDEELIEKKDETAPKYKITGGNIVASGVRIFQEPVNEKKKSLARIRGEKRRLRATIERKRERLKHLINLSKEYRLISDNFTIASLYCPKQISLTEWKTGEKSPWALRARALDERLDNFELFRVLYHIANHRGFYFLTKAERIGNDSEKEDGNTADSEAKAVKDGLKNFKQKFQSSNLRTVGEYLYKEAGERRNHKNYNICLQREDLIYEVRKIFASQRKYGNILSSDFEERYINEILLYNHIDEDNLLKMVGSCELMEDKIRFSKEGYENELFRFYNRLNTLIIGDMSLSSTNGTPLNDEQRKIRDKIFALAKSKKEVTFADLREKLLIDDSKRFNLCSYREFNPEYEKNLTLKRNDIITYKTLELYETNTGEISNNNDYIKQLQDKAKKYFDKYQNAKSVKILYADIRREFKIPDNYRFSSLKKNYCLSSQELGQKKYLEQFEKDDVFISLKGYHKIKNALKNDFAQIDSPDKLNAIAEALTYYKTDQSRAEHLKENGINDENIIAKILELNMKEVAPFCREVLEKLNSKMQDGILFNKAVEELGLKTKTKTETEQNSSKLEPYEGYFKQNPVVSRIISQFRKVFNAVIEAHCKDIPLDEIRIEVATDVANSKKKINKIRNGQFIYKEEKDKARQRCIEFGLDPDEKDTLLRMRLAEEQDFRCPYSGRHIYFGTKADSSIDGIFFKDCDIDHIIPISRSFNDSLANKVLCSNSENRLKTNKIPYEYFKDSKTPEEWEKFKAWVLSSPRIKGTKKYNLLRESFTEEDMENFISRDLNNTRYATRHIAEYLREHFDFSHAMNTNIKDVNRVRVLGGGITAKLRHMWGLEKNRDESDKHHAQDAIVIACASFGHIYYICSILKKLEEEGKRPHKQQLTPWTTFREDVLTTLNKIFVSRPPRRSATGGIHDDTIYSLNPKHKNYNEKNLKSGVKIRGGLANNGDMLRTDVFVKKNKKGKDEFFLVPIYLSNLGKELPNRAIVANKNEKEWLLIDESYQFRFSLYMDDLIKVTKNNKEIFGYFNGTDRAVGSISIEAPDRSQKYRGIGVKTQDRFQKYSVDPLGNFHEVKKEKRIPLTNVKSNRQRLHEKRLKKQEKE